MFSCLVVALLGVAFVAGCGSGGNSTSGSNSTSSSGATATSSQSGEVSSGKTGGKASGETGGKTGGETSSGAAATHPLTPKQRVETCKRILQAPSTLSASTKAKLEKDCEQTAASTSAGRLIVQEACVALASREPAGAARERALAVCRRAP
jgi:hypothetical protein